MNDQEKQRAVDILNLIMELELAGVVRYTHYSLMVYGYNRIPIVSWLKSNADESLIHAHKPASWLLYWVDIRRLKSVRYWKRPNMISAIF